MTELKGKVVGRSLRQIQFRWLRRLFTVSDADLALYDYNQFSGSNRKLPAVSRTHTTGRGEFAFSGIPDGHYKLEIRGGGLYGFFDVELTKAAKKTKWITIDISPALPDCRGGREFEIETDK